MRTTIDINDELLRQARRRAADEETSVKRVVEDALRRHLGHRAARIKRGFRWRTEKGRLRPGVRLEDRDALFDLMGERE